MREYNSSTKKPGRQIHLVYRVTEQKGRNWPAHLVLLNVKLRRNPSLSLRRKSSSASSLTNIRYSLTQECANELENPVRPNLLKIALSFPIYESTVPAARLLGQLQVLQEHERTWSFCFPAASMLVKNFTMSSAIAAEDFFGGTRERKKLDSWTSDESFCRS